MVKNRLSTGLVIAGAYADKVRRTLFAQAKQAGIEPREVVRASAELNRLLFEILVNKLGIDKGDAVRVRIEYTVDNGRVVWDYNTLEIEAFKRLNDEEIKKIIAESIKKKEDIFSQPVSEEEKEMVGAEAEAVREAHELKKQIMDIDIQKILLIGKNKESENIFIVKDSRSETIGVIVAKEEGSGTKTTAVIVEEGKGPLYIENIFYGDIKKLEDPEIIKQVLSGGKRKEISKEEAKQIIKSKLEGLI